MSRVKYAACSQGFAKPKRGIRAPDEYKSYVCVWDDKEAGTFGRACLDMYVDGLQAWFPWGGEEHSPSNFRILRKKKNRRYIWVGVQKALDKTEKYQPITHGDYSPCVIKGLLGKIWMDGKKGWTCYGGNETQHDGDDLMEGKVLCARRRRYKKQRQCPGEWVNCHTGDTLFDGAVGAPDGEDSYVVMWNEKEEGTFGRASLDKHMPGLQAWFPWGGEEYDSQNVGEFQLLREDDDFTYYWIPVRAIKKHRQRYEVVKYNGLSPTVINGKCGKAKIDEMKGWTCYAGTETFHTEDEVMDGLVLCYKEHECGCSGSDSSDSTTGDESSDSE